MKTCTQNAELKREEKKPLTSLLKNLFACPPLVSTLLYLLLLLGRKPVAIPRPQRESLSRAFPARVKFSFSTNFFPTETKGGV